MSLFKFIGAMSGTSMDGLDLAYCEIKEYEHDQYTYKILNARTYPYPSEILNQLKESKTLTSERIFALDKKLGHFFSDCILSFVKSENITKSELSAVASHGHTVFHQPEKGFTVQIGCGATMAKKIGVPVINDFRQRDVIAGGQGAPLVPIGDQFLFSDRADAFLNIGGFTNISLNRDQVVAFDISPGNLPLNLISMELGKPFDENGGIARTGKLDETVLQKLNALPYYQQKAPKSLGTEWLDSVFMPILRNALTPADQLHTCVVHIADQIAKVCIEHKIESLFITGGGVFNGFLLEKLNQKGIKIVIPNPLEINYKEALVFAFLGVRFLQKKYNCLASVTGASENVCGGTLHLP